ncbi:MAG TPA: hypothetical protein V6C95_22315 [Coleofasciculaceae cyanobacterium]
MVLVSSIALIIALISFYICVNATDEIVQVAAAITSLSSVFILLVFAPLVVKLLILVALVFAEKYTNRLATVWTRHHN